MMKREKAGGKKPNEATTKLKGDEAEEEGRRWGEEEGGGGHGRAAREAKVWGTMGKARVGAAEDRSEA